MKLNREHITLLAVALIAVLLTLQISSALRGRSVDEKYIRNEMKLEQMEEKRLSDSVYHAESMAQKDSVIALLKNRDAVIVNQYIKTNEKLKDIPARINNLNADSLRKQIINY